MLQEHEHVVAAASRVDAVLWGVFGLTQEVFTRAIQAGFVERLNSVAADPTTAAGFDAWRYTVRVLRQELEERGWRLDNPRNLPLAIRDDLRVNMTISSGDILTGINGKEQPKSKNPRGEMFKAAIDRNIDQVPLLPEMLTDAESLYYLTFQYPTWVLLIHFEDEAIRAELSLPITQDGEDRLSGWKHRIILDVPLPGEEHVTDIHDDGDDDIVPEVRARS